MWQAVAFVSSGFTLAAFIAAGIVWVAKLQTEKRANLIRLAKPARRAALVESALEFFHVNTAKLTQSDRCQVALQQIKARADRFRITAIVIVILAVIAAALAAFAIFMTYAPKTIPTPIPGPSPTPSPPAPRPLGIRLSPRRDPNTPSASLFVMFDDGSRRLLTKNSGATEPSFDFSEAQVSKDCRYVVYTSFVDSNGDGAITFSDSPQVYLHDVRQNTKRLLTLGESGFGSWSPDSEHLAYTDSRDGDGEVWILNVSTQDRKQVTESAHWGGHAKWAPSGRYISFYSADAAGTYLSVVHPDGSDYRRISPSVGNGWGTIWSADNHIAFNMNSPGHMGRFLADPDSTTLQPRQPTGVRAEDREMCAWPTFVMTQF